MSVWRRKAVLLFPELKADVKDWTSAYQLFFDLLPFAMDSHRLRNEDALFRVYGFAEWCLHQKSKELWNPVGVCFYEHLFDEQDKWDDVIRWLSPSVIKECLGLWQARLSDAKYQQLKLRLSSREISRGNSFRSGQIEAL